MTEQEWSVQQVPKALLDVIRILNMREKRPLPRRGLTSFALEIVRPYFLENQTQAMCSFLAAFEACVEGRGELNQHGKAARRLRKNPLVYDQSIRQFAESVSSEDVFVAACNAAWHCQRLEGDVAAGRLSSIIRCIFGNPFRPISFSPEWRTTTAVAIAQSMYDSRDFGPMPVLADALQDAGCEVPEIIDHCRGPGPHVRGCWVVDGVLGKA
ncbi:MAG: hypothetical protein U0791_24575 [Gemmataceae bacterium]